MTQINVSQEALKNLNDIQYKFHAFESKLEHMSPKVKAEFAELFGAVNALFKEHNEQVDKADKLNRAVLEKIQDEYGFEAIWSISNVSDMYADFGYVEAVEYLGHTEVVGQNVNWVELWEIADRLIEKSGDSHHIFIENFSKEKDGIVHHLITGS
jgi:hypothetical protein